MKTSVITSFLASKLAAVVAVCAIVFASGTQWSFGTPAYAAPAMSAAASEEPAAGSGPAKPGKPDKPGKRQLAGKLNLNTASEEQLQLLPTVGPAKAERVVTWRKKNGGFKRVADLRRVKGFGYKTMKKLEPYLDIKGDNTLVAQ